MYWLRVLRHAWREAHAAADFKKGGRLLFGILGVALMTGLLYWLSGSLAADYIRLTLALVAALILSFLLVFAACLINAPAALAREDAHAHEEVERELASRVQRLQLELDSLRDSFRWMLSVTDITANVSRHATIPSQWRMQAVLALTNHSAVPMRYELPSFR